MRGALISTISTAIPYNICGLIRPAQSNLCYLNTLVQMIMSTTTGARYLSQYPNFSVAYQRGQPYLLEASLPQVIQQLSGHLVLGEQQDIHETFMIWTGSELELRKCFRSVIHQHMIHQQIITKQVTSITCMLVSSEEGNNLRQCVAAYMNPAQPEILPRLLRYKLITPANILAFSIKRTYWEQGLLTRDDRCIRLPQTLVGIENYPGTAQLKAIACHSGGSESGHYICYAKRHGQWHKIDDANHHSLSTEIVMESSARTWVIAFYEI